MHGGRGCGRGHSSFGNKPTCQLCGKYGHVVVDCWHRFDEHFTHTQAYAKASEFSYAPIDKPEASTFDPQALPIMSTAHKYSLH